VKVSSIFDLLGLTVVAVIAIDILTSKNTAGNVSAAGNAWSQILKSAQGK
jgi:hypothetical protein